MITQHLKLFESLSRNKVEYLLIGGMLAIAYGVPRATKDIDLFINPTPKNAQALLDTLEQLGFGCMHLTNAADICATEITIFKDYLRIDVLTKVKGIEFEESWKNRKDLMISGVTIQCLSPADLIKSKKASARPRDLEDVKLLELATKKKH